MIKHPHHPPTMSNFVVICRIYRKKVGYEENKFADIYYKKRWKSEGARSEL